ncbi:MAG: carboxypeptidase-like regulatory domain-containing protein [Methanoregula sp.]
MNYAILVLVGISLIIPGVYAEPDVGTSIAPAGDPAISLDIKAPQENKIFLNLGQPPHITVIGYVRNSQSLQSVIVSSSEGSTDCGNTSFISCTIPVTKGLNRITITATDPNGSHVSTTRNFSVQYGVPGLPTRITISGKITTPDGHPIEGAMVRTHYTESAIAESEADGSYRINNARGFRQIMSVEKEGYTNVTKEMVFNKNLNTVDFILEPTTKSVSGFTAILCLVGILGTLLIISRKERTR